MAKNPYVEHFLEKHPSASDVEARFGEAAWDAAIEAAAALIARDVAVSPATRCRFEQRLVKLKSTKQRAG